MSAKLARMPLWVPVSFASPVDFLVGDPVCHMAADLRCGIAIRFVDYSHRERS